jgi:uridine kinase
MKIQQVMKRSGKLEQFDIQKIARSIFRAAAEVGGRNRELSEKLAAEVVGILEASEDIGHVATSEEIGDLVEKVLIENGHARTAKAFIVYRSEQANERKRRKQIGGVEGNIPYKIMWRVLVWNVEHGVDTVEGLNKRVLDGSFARLVSDAEEDFERQISFAASQIWRAREETRLVVIAGPSSSGKTTTTAKLTEKLTGRGMKIVPLNLDNYFFDLEEHPKDEFGDYDFEVPEALDLSLINEHLADLLSGKRVESPVYDFKSGKRISETRPVQVEPDEVILIDTLHGLYAPMTESIPTEAKFRVYIETISQLRDLEGDFTKWTDIRLLRRMIRDYKHRNYEPAHTIRHWHYVRRSELKYIVPNLKHVDYILNGALPYELPVLKKYLFDYFPAFIQEFRNVPKQRDAFIRAARVHDLLESIEEVKDDSCIPDDSLLREFIGGSRYKLH